MVMQLKALKSLPSLEDGEEPVVPTHKLGDPHVRFPRRVWTRARAHSYAAFHRAIFSAFVRAGPFLRGLSHFHVGWGKSRTFTPGSGSHDPKISHAFFLLHVASKFTATVAAKLKRQREESSDTSLSPAAKVPAAAATPHSNRTLDMAVAPALRASIEEQIRTTHVLLYCKTTCPYCSKVSPG